MEATVASTAEAATPAAARTFDAGPGCVGPGWRAGPESTSFLESESAVAREGARILTS